MYMNICIYTVHLFLYKCITCKVKSCLSNYCTFHISYVTTNRQKYKIASMKKIFFVNILSLLLVRPKIFINITSDVFYCHAPGKKSPWILHPSPAMISCDFLTCSIHGIQQRHLILWSMIIYFPPPCWTKILLLDLGMESMVEGTPCYPFMITFQKMVVIVLWAILLSIKTNQVT